MNLNHIYTYIEARNYGVSNCSKKLTFFVPAISTSNFERGDPSPTF